MFKRIFWVFVPAVLVLFGGVAMLSFYLVHKLSHPPRVPLFTSPRDFNVIFQKPMWSDDKWKTGDGLESVGWFLTQGKPAPAIILSHSYGSNRSELMTLGFELWKAGYHVLLYDMRGHGESTVKWSGLGSYEQEDVLSAINYLKSLKTEEGQHTLDGRIGLYGVGLGGYASLAASTQDAAVKAIAVDSPYPDVRHFINHRLKLMVGSEKNIVHDMIDSAWAAQLSDLTLQLYLLRRSETSEAEVASALARPTLFLTGPDAGALADLTRELYGKAKEPKQFIEIDKTRLDRLYDQSATYDARIVTFFRDTIPTKATNLMRPK